MIGCKIDFKYSSSSELVNQGIVVAQIIETNDSSKPQTKFLVQLTGGKQINNSTIVKILPSAITYVSTTDIKTILRNGQAI